jgi:hypothetical protein
MTDEAEAELNLHLTTPVMMLLLALQISHHLISTGSSLSDRLFGLLSRDASRLHNIGNLVFLTGHQLPILAGLLGII